MAVRLRKDKYGEWKALCAAEFAAREGDTYLDDNQDYALRMKYLKDYSDEGLIDREDWEDIIS